MTAEILLYSTWGCHLCEQAETLLVQAGMGGQFRVLDIIDDEQLLVRFRTSIPVLACNDKLLYWPFDAVALADWLEEVR